ncbi:hypothetical protein ACWD4B_26620, partial [Streptomyces sp. NPDC002536]
MGLGRTAGSGSRIRGTDMSTRRSRRARCGIRGNGRHLRRRTMGLGSARRGNRPVRRDRRHLRRGGLRRVPVAPTPNELRARVRQRWAVHER